MQQGGWVEIAEECLDSEAVRCAIAKSDVDVEKISVEPIEAWDKIQARYRKVIESKLDGFGWSHDAANGDVISLHPPSYALKLLSSSKAVICCGGHVMRCPRLNGGEPRRIKAEILVLESFESCSGAYGYRLFVRCGCCRAVYVDPWVHITL